MTRTPTGRIDREGEQWVLTLQREFRAPIEDVWASVTESERLARWIGTWTGDPTSGRVAFTMTAEGATEPEEMEIRACVPPRLLEVTLVESEGVTTLTFTQPDLDLDDAESVGPGWEYYLDRLAATETGTDLTAIDFERDYYPAMLEHYQRQLG